MNLKYKLKILFIFLIIFTAYNTYGQVIISEYYEGSSSNKWIEVTNVGSATINLTSPQLYLSLFANAKADDPANSQANNHNAMSGSLNPGQVILYKNSNAVLPSYATGTSSSSCGFNGDDLIVISSSSTNSSGDVWGARLDVIGAGNNWGTNKAFYRNSNITSANTTYTTGEWTQVTYSAVDNASNTASEYLGTHLYDAPVTSTTWTGGTDTDWATASNWSNGVPTSSLDASIPDVTNAPIISGSTNASVNNLAITESDGLTINSGGSLIVSGTSSGNVTHNRNLATTNWYLMSSPVIGETYDNAYVTANSIASGTQNTNSRGIAPYVTTDDSWDYMLAGETATFTAGNGYSVKRSATGDISFTGTLNVDNAGVDVVLSSSGNRFNLLGNPYTSHIASATFLTNEAAVSETQTLWVWNQATGASGAYKVKTISDAMIIAPAQGFFVKANAAGGTFNFAESNQASTGGTFQRTENRQEIYLTISNQTDAREAKIYYIENMTTGFDVGYEGELFNGVSNPLAIYTHLVADSEGKNYQVQSLPTNNYENMIVPVGVNATSGSAITIDASTNNLPEGVNIYLEDKQDNSFTLLNADTNFNSTLENDLSGIGRFYLHTTSESLSTAALGIDSNISIYKSSSDNIRIVGVQNGTANVQMYNMLGKEVLKTSFEGNGVNDIKLNTIPMGIYIVKIATENGTLNRKIIIQ
jgi:hypothetical protein